MISPLNLNIIKDKPMTPPQEFSASGTPIYRHNRPVEGISEAAPFDQESHQALTQHITRYVGPIDHVLHEPLPETIPIDLHIVAPTPERNYFTLVTAGMSDLPMRVPPGHEDEQYAELVMCLPPNWDLSETGLKDARHNWPLHWLKLLARLPHTYGTRLSALHTVPNGDPAQPFAENTDMCCMLILKPFLFGGDFLTLEATPEKTIQLLSVIPIYPEEMTFKLQHGIYELLPKLQAIGLNERLDLERTNVGL
jgi:hypothetical protein